MTAFYENPFIIAKPAPAKEKKNKRKTPKRENLFAGRRALLHCLMPYLPQCTIGSLSHRHVCLYIFYFYFFFFFFFLFFLFLGCFLVFFFLVCSFVRSFFVRRNELHRRVCMSSLYSYTFSWPRGKRGFGGIWVGWGVGMGFFQKQKPGSILVARV